MRNIITIGICLFLFLMTACQSSTNLISCSYCEKQNNDEALKRISKIQEGMTFGQISTMIPLSPNSPDILMEHGGMWYAVTLGRYWVHLRFEHPSHGKKNIDDCVLNYPPVVKLNAEAPAPFLPKK